MGCFLCLCDGIHTGKPWQAGSICNFPSTYSSGDRFVLVSIFAGVFGEGMMAEMEGGVSRCWNVCLRIRRLYELLEWLSDSKSIFRNWDDITITKSK